MSIEKDSPSIGSDELNVDEFAGEETYSAPAQKSMKEIIETDNNDESLRKYKAQLLGGTEASEKTVLIDPNNPSNVILKRISLVTDGQVKHTMELPATSDFTFTIKEGCAYRIRFEFFVQREIVSGLKYAHKLSRLGVGVTKELYMIGSYGPRMEAYIFETPSEEAPSGMLSRGKYRVRSLITDDDKNKWFEWTWHIEIAKNW